MTIDKPTIEVLPSYNGPRTTVWVIYNGYLGNGEPCVILPEAAAGNEEQAIKLAVPIFAADDKRPEYSTPNERWRVERLPLPACVELS